MISDKKLTMLIDERLESIDEIAPVVTTTLITMNLLSMVYKIYKDYISKLGRACSDWSGSTKTICTLKFRINASKLFIQKAKQKQISCRDTKNPDSCYKRFNELIEKHKEKIKSYQKQLNELKKYTLR